MNRLKPLLAAALMLGASIALGAEPLGTTFTYQGKLASGGQVATGLFDFKFSIFDSTNGVTAIAAPLELTAVGVTNGLFTAKLNFGPNVFTGEARWLEIAVRTNGTGAAYHVLPPRQLLTPAPYALWAQNAQTAAQATGLQPGAVSAGSLNTPGAPASGQVLTYDGSQLTWMSLGGAGIGTWNLSGNAGTAPGANFLGTTDKQALEFKVNGQRALRLDPAINGAPNVIGGFAGNEVKAGISAATIAGGGGNTSPNVVAGDGGTVGGGFENQALGLAAAIAGGQANAAGGDAAAIGGGLANTIATNAGFATIPGGQRNVIEAECGASSIGGGTQNRVTNAFAATISGGNQNLGSGLSATVSGGEFNQATGWYSAIPGGSGNRANGRYSFAAGGDHNHAKGDHSFAAGRRAKATNQGAFVWADSMDADFASTHNDEFSVRAAGGVRIESGLGISLNTTNGPLITCGWDSFTSGPYAGLGRWGLFMEPTTTNLAIAIPGDDVPGRGLLVVKYATNGTPTPLLAVDQEGNLHIRGEVMPFARISDRAVKQDFSPVNSLAVVEKVARLPMQTWAYTNSPAVRHMGPMAQDFYATFALGNDDKRIAAVDAEGVALAAIQGLNQRIDSQNADLREELKRRGAENAELRQRITALEQLVQSLTHKFPQ